MLRITTESRPDGFTFLVEGKLVGAWAKELEQTWKQSAASREQRTAIVDLSETQYIDSEGRRVLAKLASEGARFRTACPLIESMIEVIVAEIAGKSSAALQSVLWLCVLAIFVAGGARAGQAPAATGVQAGGQAPPLRLTLRDAVQMALKQNPQVQIANLNTAVAQENRIVARSALLPQANLAVSEEVMRENLVAFLGMKVPGFPEHSGPFWLFQGGANGSAPLLDLVAWHRWRASKENVTGARAEEQTVREQDALLVVSQYLGSLRDSADVTAAQSRVELAKALLEQASDLQKNGVGIAIDTLRANVEYQNEQQRLLDARTALQTSLFALARLLNMDPHRNIELADASEFFQTPAFSAGQTIEQAYMQRPEMKQLASQIRSAELEKRAAEDAKIPRLALNGQWNEEGLSPAAAIPAYTVSAGLDVPLYTGGRIRAEVATAELNLKKLAQQQTDLRNQIAQEVKTAAAQLDAAKSEVDVANSGLALAREEVTQARDRFQAGVANNIEVITAQDELSRASDNQIVALYQYNQARADLAHATGQMESLYAQ